MVKMTMILMSNYKRVVQQLIIMVIVKKDTKR
jgi:hypothetical protein